MSLYPGTHIPSWWSFMVLYRSKCAQSFLDEVVNKLFAVFNHMTCYFWKATKSRTKRADDDKSSWIRILQRVIVEQRI